MVLQAGVLILWSSDNASKTKVSVPVAVVNLLAALVMVCLSWAEDARSIRPSSLLGLYLFFSLFFDMTQVRTLWLRGTSLGISIVSSAAITVKFVLLFLESQNKRRYLLASYRQLPPESTSGILNRSVLWWVNELFRRGYQSLIKFDSLWVLDEELTSEGLSHKIHRAWDRRRVPERRTEYAWAIFYVLWWPFLQAVVPRLCLIAFTFAQPLFISAALDLLIQPRSQMTDAKAYGLVGAAALIYIGLAISRLLYDHKLYRAITMARGATVSIIHSRALETQDGLYDESAAITLMSTDTDRVVAILENLFECWAQAVELFVGIGLLAHQMGWVCVMPLIIVFSKYFFFLASRNAKGPSRS